MADEKPDSAPSGNSGGGNKLVLILTGVNLLVTLAVIGVLFMAHKKEQATSSVGDIAVEEGGGHGEEKAEGGHGEEGGHGGGGGHGEAGGHGEKAEAGKPHGPDGGKMLPLEQFTVNLATVGSASARFARVDISVEVPTDDTEAELARKMPQVRNTIIDLFNSKRPSDLSTPEGRNYLKDEIKNALNSFLITGKIKGVFFTGFALSS